MLTRFRARISTSVASVLVGVVVALPLMAKDLPLGDGRISTTPRVGYLMSCVQDFPQRALHSGPWIHGDEWNPADKTVVQGSVDWPTHRISISIENGQRVISADNLPDHPTGIFPISRTDPAYQYDRNPNSIRPQDILLHLPLTPQVAAHPSCVPMGMIGFSTDGVAIYNAVDASGKDAAAHEIQDKCSGHPQHMGQYHYHGPSPCMTNEITSGLVGYALDGFGIYGMRDPVTGKILNDSDLDACHGTTSPVLWDGKKVSMYHYVLTAEYPYTIGCFRGTPVMGDFRSRQTRQLLPRPGGNPPHEPGAMGNNHQQRLERAARILGVSTQALRAALGPPPPDLNAAAQKLGISVQALREALGPPSDVDNQP